MHQRVLETVSLGVTGWVTVLLETGCHKDVWGRSAHSRVSLATREPSWPLLSAADRGCSVVKGRG